VSFAFRAAASIDGMDMDMSGGALGTESNEALAPKIIMS
jgi:hypothetical protein